MIEQLRLDDLIILQRGFDITVKEQTAGTIPIISSGGISSYHNEYKVEGPGVVIGRKGTLGKVYFSLENFWPHDTTLWIKDFKGNDPKFIYYLLQVLHFEKFDAGAANPTLNRNHIHSLKLKVPKKEFRSRIASILTSYDDLIENNKQRIQLLEEMADEIYKEWFVRLRFPGYETAKIVDGLPEGWEETFVEEIVQRYNPGKKYDNKSALEKGNIPILDQGQSGIIGFHNDEPGVQASMEDPIIVFANHTCYQNLIQFNFSAIQNILPFKSNKKYSRNIYWLHYATKDIIEFNDYKGHWPEFSRKKITIGDEKTTDSFGFIIKPMVNEIQILKDKNHLLQETRDLLLPRLISGKLSVAHLVKEELGMVAEESAEYNKTLK